MRAKRNTECIVRFRISVHELCIPQRLKMELIQLVDEQEGCVDQVMCWEQRSTDGLG